ncbi:VTT domain-containing protein [Lentzea sp. BCCO 10_0856]|uniref:TVP38/TMEM64 family membrane protein n=1 Tax=Lentzea miocenica TaxID=3095431 RepID=A0ABU4T9I3_9PSEU|nr:VTT domain-containing protein [Lentzea sp. BCCO 10_0856]MDX8034821.1 VTT domain-containing protein [Lentzea sp. BCCO 10_0856]
MREVRAITLLALVVALVVISFVVDLPGGDEVRSWIRGAGAWAPAAFLLLCAGGTAVFFPKPVLATASGLLFGILPGAALAIAGFTAGALISFGIGRLLGREAVARWLGDSCLRTLDEVFAKNGLAATLVLRLLPVIPFAASNYGAGVTAVRPALFALGTALGLVPTTLVAALLGDAVLDLGSPRSIAALVAWLVIGVAGVLWGRNLLCRAARTS